MTRDEDMLVTGEDFYGRLADMGLGKRQAVWRLLCHLVDHAPLDEAWLKRLLSLDVARMHIDMRRLLCATLEYSPAAVRLLAPEQARALGETPPPGDGEAPIELSEAPVGLRRYREWGFII